MMRVFVAGATGAVGKQLVPRLVAAGHAVVGMTHSESKRALLHELGAEPVVADALDPDQVAEVVARARPEVIVHQLTAIESLDPRHFDRDFALTNRLRTEGTDYLLSAGQAMRVRRFVAQSYGAWPYVRTGGPVKTEEDPLDPTLGREMRQSRRSSAATVASTMSSTMTPHRSPSGCRRWPRHSAPKSRCACRGSSVVC